MGKINKKYSKFNIDEIKNLAVKIQKKTINRMPASIEKNFDIDELTEEKCVCYRMRPKKGFNGTYIVYIYGSFTCFNMSIEQWEFISKLSQDTGCGLFVPMYPLAPEFGCREVFKMLKKAYANFCLGHDVNKVILLGDSSGAGLALSITMLAWKEGFRKPDQLILLSPFIDTEFFDKKLETMVFEGSKQEDRFWFNEAFKDFINTYWVKDYAVKTEYTSPFYEDYTDLCDDVCIFSGTRDMFNCYAREFYSKAKKDGVNIRFYEFDNEPHNFIIYGSSHDAKKAYEYLEDIINQTYNASLTNIFPIKLLAEWTKKYPEDVNDEWALKFIYDNKFDFSKLPVKISRTSNLMLAATTSACDQIVRKYIMEYPNCTVINLGCTLENAFSRMDNGRIQWYNIDTHNIISVRRAMYGERSREKTIGRAIMNFTWMDEVVCERNKGVLFICKDVFPYMRLNQVKTLIEKIRESFPGAELVFTASSTGSNLHNNMNYRKRSLKQKKKRLAVDDAQELFNEWRTDIQIISEEPVMKYFRAKKEAGPMQKLAIKYNMITNNHKIVRMRIGSEDYNIRL